MVKRRDLLAVPAVSQVFDGKPASVGTTEEPHRNDEALDFF
jgi:hypothetical protein